MDPILTIWLSGAIFCFVVGNIAGAVYKDYELVFGGIITGVAFPIVLVLGTIALLGCILSSPYFIARYFIERNHRKELALKKLDADLDKHIQETKELIGQ